MSFSALDRAHEAMRGQQWAAAARDFDAALAEQPQLIEARVGRARCAMLLAEPQVAIEHLRAAAQFAPANPAVARSLGVALLAVDSFAAAVLELQRARALDPQDPLTRLQLGQALEAQGRLRPAAQSYYRALVQAQLSDRWLDRASTPAHLHAAVLHAMDLVDQQRRGLLQGLIEPFCEQYGAVAMARVMRCLDGHLKSLTLPVQDSAQRPRFLLVPDLPATRFFEPSLLPWLAELESAYPALRAEALSVDDALQPFLTLDSAERTAQYLASSTAPPAWDAFFFYRDGARIEANHQRCPQTSALLERLPLVRIREHAPEICFSVLAPGTHILPHTGVSNLRVVVHLPLLIPDNCAIEVGGEIHSWREGQAVVFDDTFEHQAWNRSAQRRIILLMDTWNPYLTDIERAALTVLVAGIGDFNRD